jgi:predicted nucleic acid-binding protein
VIYWDTSALVKQYLAEVGTEQVLALRTQDLPHATSMITYSEIFSALRRRVRERFLPATRYRKAIDLFKRDWQAFVRVQLDEEIIMLSAKLIERHPLKTLDAIHLTSVLQLQQLVGEPSLLVSSDNQLLQSATAENVTVRHIAL